MGWLFHSEKLRHQTPAEYLTQHFTHDSESYSATVIATATVRGTVYAAIRNLNKGTGAGYIFCAVILFKSSDKDGFGYKDMDDGTGPCEADCPERIMRLLSPLSDIPSPGYAAEWRARVIERRATRTASQQASKALRLGDVIRLPAAVSFPGRGVTADRFRLIERRKQTPIFEPVERPGMRCRLRRSTLAAATIER